MFEGHEESVTCLHSRGGVMVSGARDRAVRLWCLDTGRALRVLRRAGSPLAAVSLVAGRLLWWASSGAFCISSWDGGSRVEARTRFTIAEDPDTCRMCIGERYVVTCGTDQHGLGTRDVVVYSSHTGMRLFEKDIFSGQDITCLALRGHLLCVGAGSSVELWDVAAASCLAILQPGLATPAARAASSVTRLCVSSHQLVALLASSQLICVPLQLIVRESLASCGEPAVISWSSAGAVVENSDRAWKNMSMTDDRFVFGLEKKLGDIKLYHWKRRRKNTRGVSQHFLNCDDDDELDLK